jgi:flagellar hook protein FlgE
VTPDGHFLQGYTGIDPVTGAVIATGPLSNITVNRGVLRAPTATTSFTSQTNLDATTAAGATFSTSIQTYDSLGAPHVATITFTKQAAAGAWTYQVTVPGAEVTGGVAGTPFAVGNGTVGFDGTGQLTSVNGGAPADVNIATPGWTNGAGASAWAWNIVDPNGGFTLSSYASPSSTSSITQNGVPPGTMDNIAITADGTITGTFGGGQTIAIAQIALATFNNMKGLAKLGSNLYMETEAAGLPSIGVPGTGARGTLFGSAIELSNVDIAQEFTQMILAQRGYQANSKTITVSDELLLDTLNIKR